MSAKNLEQFYRAAQSDAALQERLKAAPDKESYLQGVVDAGKEKGYSFSRDDVLTAIESVHASRQGEGKELSDAQLQSVAGGRVTAFFERWYYERYTSGYRAC